LHGQREKAKGQTTILGTRRFLHADENTPPENTSERKVPPSYRAVLQSADLRTSDTAGKRSSPGVNPCS
jgi:hypothetical protein